MVLVLYNVLTLLQITHDFTIHPLITYIQPVTLEPIKITYRPMPSISERLYHTYAILERIFYVAKDTSMKVNFSCQYAYFYMVLVLLTLLQITHDFTIHPLILDRQPVTL